uniref:Uncharacterized protein n=1 Tax=Clastoptera arizonana TaxID=38151 RepID=A0A1B6CR18_9HEMI
MVIFEHFLSKHNICVVNEALTFGSEEEFFEWKREIEKSENCFYSKSRKNKITNKNHCVVSYFNCFRDGFYNSAAKKRHSKVLGSNKINGFCPASINAHISASGKVEVKYCKTHIGHTNELGRLRLSKSERNKIATKILAKEPYDDILNSIRSDVSKDLERKHLVTRQDLYNITKSLNPNCDEIYH